MQSTDLTESILNRDLSLDVFTVHGRLDGPTVMVTAGIHGTEVAGIHAAERLYHHPLLRGMLIVMPIVNTQAYRLRQRGNPDVNRTFPRHRNDRPNHRISRQVFDIATKVTPQWCIDLHEANGYYKTHHSNLGQTVIVHPNRETRRIASKVVLRVNEHIMMSKKKFSVISRQLPGSCRHASGVILKAHAVTVETSMHQPLKARVNFQTMILEAFLHELGMLPRHPVQHSAYGPLENELDRSYRM